MDAVQAQMRSNAQRCVQRSQKLAASKSRFACVLSACIAASSLLMPTPAAFGQNVTTADTNDVQHLTCVKEGQRLVCDIQQPGQPNKVITFEQKPYTGKASESVELTPVARTALISPELDEIFASTLLWVFYIGLPINVVLAIWLHDKRTSKRTAELKEQVDMLERIWKQNPQVR